MKWLQRMKKSNKEIELVKSQTEEKFQEVQHLMMKNAIQQKEEERLIMEAHESYEKETIRSELIDIELNEYQEEYDKLQDTNINDEQIVQISLDHCFRQAQKVIPNFKEKYESQLTSDLKSDFCSFTTKLLKILKEESISLSSAYLSKLSSIRSQLLSNSQSMQSDAKSLLTLSKLSSLTKSPSANLFEILRTIKSSEEIRSYVETEMQQEIGVLLNYNHSRLTNQEIQLVDSVFSRIMDIARIKDGDRWDSIRTQVEGDTWMQRAYSLLQIDFGMDMQVDEDVSEEQIIQAYNLLAA